MRWLLVSFILISFATPVSAGWNQYGTCVNVANTGEASKSPGIAPRVCFISVSGVGCYYIYNSTGKDVFIPTKSTSEFSQFVSNPPAGISVTAGTAGSDCFPACHFSGTCPGVAGSSTNPP